MVKDTKTKTSFALSSHARQLIEEMARALGVSQAAVVEMATRKLAKLEGVTLPVVADEEKQADAQR